MTETSLPAPTTAAAAKGSRLGYWVLLFTFLVMLAATGLAVRNMRHQLKGEILKLQTKLEQSGDNQDDQLESLQETLNNTKLRVENNLNDHQSRLSELEQRIQDHQSRLQSLTNRTLDDRLLAETLLLLKQANLRLLLERDAPGALLLIAEAEHLLNKTTLVDPELLAVRQAINRDLTALKLVKPLDKEGLYLQLTSLLELIPQLPQQPEFTPARATPEEEMSAPDEHSSWTDWLGHSLHRLRIGIKNYVRLDDRSNPDKPILTPEAARLIELDLRLQLEQAQTALLQQRSVIFKQSLKTADQLLAEYYWESPVLSEYRRNLQRLSDEDVTPTLPSLAESLTQLQAYLDHKRDNNPGGATP